MNALEGIGLPLLIGVIAVLAALYGCPPQHEDDTREPFAEEGR